MTQPILAFQSSPNKETPKTKPNLLPCKIHHDGSVEPIESFWNPRDEDGIKTAYFRGRKLHGYPVPLPSGYRGIIASKSKSTQPSSAQSKQEQQKPRMAHEMSFVMDNSPEPEPEVVDLDAEEEREKEPQVGGEMEVQAEFNQFVVWGHETLADAVGDGYVRGVEEWVGFAGRVHSF
ncbi:ribonuclease H2, subunit C [Sordaria brevicollis]|uniref:Ribonuclease H2, subunit C n=1 Tax=Sordaria brevicollis TaxID=83679 RepID=A0AAE0UCM0_SORBR|nr:ribonuclease H2, subunit C [Sordaria brevicollis]